MHELYNPFCNRLYYETKNETIKNHLFVRVLPGEESIRLCTANGITGIYAIISYINIIPIYSTLIAKIILSISMIYIAYFPKNIKLCFKELVLFYVVSFVFGGCAFALLYIIKPQNILIKNE